MFIGVDIGGTFTDIVTSSEGRLSIHKLLSTPHNPAEAMLAGLQAVGMSPSARVSHGSTVATNAILERKGGRTALITTQGFRDVLEIGRQNRPQLYALHPQLPPPLIPRELRFEVPERLDYVGNILLPLDNAALDRVLDDIQATQVEAVAVCLLYSFINPQHEQAIKARLIARQIVPAEQISLSSEVLPQFREYERTSTVALDAYVRPVMNRYLQTLEDQLPPTSKLLVMKSNGGVISAKGAREQAVQTALSGPAAGVMGAFHIAQLAGYTQIITLDMGGTSTDVALCPGQPIHRPESEIDGLPLRIPSLDIETVGAGGGSLARVDAGGALPVGPASAGAMPGPMIYGRGGQQLTVSDANALLGRLDADHFLGGQMALQLTPAQTALQALAQTLNLSPEQAALGILEIANVNIDRAIRRVSIGRGYDPRQFTLMAFGGAGGLHACEVAERLEIPRVLIPRYPGVLCALGLLVADVQRDYSRAILKAFNADLWVELQAELSLLIAQASQDLAQEGIPADAMRFQGLLDVRYQGQSYELTIPFSDSLAEAFHTAHRQRYAHAMPHRSIEVVNLRLQAIGQVEKPNLAAEPLHSSQGEEALLGYKPVWGKDGSQVTALYDREKLVAGTTLTAPALIFQLDSTTYIPAHWKAQVDAYRNLIVERL